MRGRNDGVLCEFPSYDRAVAANLIWLKMADLNLFYTLGFIDFCIGGHAKKPDHNIWKS